MDDENPYAPPQADVFWEEDELDQPSKAWRYGKLLMVRKGAELPDRCLKCNAPAEGYRVSRNLSWLDPVWSLLILLACGPILYIVLFLILRSQGRVTAGLCPHHRTAHARAIALGWAIALLGLGSLIAIGVLPDRFVPTAVIAAIVLVLAGLITGSVGSRVMVTKRIDKHFVYLAKVSPDYLAMWPEWKI
jgi:hypothetical protein